MRSNFEKKASSSGNDPDAIELAYWLQNSSSNDPAVLDRLVNHYGRELYRWVEILAFYRKEAQPSQSEILDILKEVFKTAIKNVEQFHGNDSVSDWLFGIAYQVTNRWRFSPEAQVVNKKLHQAMGSVEQPQKLIPTEQDELRLFSEKIRTALLLRYLYLLRLPEIARILDIQANDVHQRLIKGRKKLLRNPVKAHMEVKIEEFLDGMLEEDPDKIDKLNRHIAECEDCQHVLEQLETLEDKFADELEARWVLPTLNNKVLITLIQAITNEMTNLETKWTIKLPLRQISWIIGLAVMLAGLAILSIRIMPVEKEFATPEISPPQQLPPVIAPIVEKRQFTGLTNNNEFTDAPQYIAPAFSSDGKWAVFAETHLSMNSSSLIFQTIELYNREASTLRVINESSTFVNSWAWWDLAPSISGDGRWIAYVSTSRYLDINGNACTTPDDRACLDIFLYDRITGTTKRLTQSASGGAADGDSLAPTVSEDGEWVAFWSTADNLAVGSKNTCEFNGSTIACLYIYLYHVVSGKTGLIPIRMIPGDSIYGVDRISLSADARYIGFTLSNLAQGIPFLDSALPFCMREEVNNSYIWKPICLNSGNEAVIYDRVAAKFELENKTQGGVQGDRLSSSPVISADGRYVAFVSASTNLVVGDNNNFSDVFIRDRETGEIEIASVSSTGQQGQGDSGNIYPSRGYYSLNLSDDGRYVVFESSAKNLGVSSNQECNNTNIQDCRYQYIHDRQTGNTELISGLSNQDFTLFPDIISNGQWISFTQYFHNCSSTQSQCSNVMLYNQQRHWTSNLTKFDGDIPTLPWSYSGSLSLPWETWETSAFALSPDSTQIALGGYDSKVRIWKISEVNDSIPRAEPDKILEITVNDSLSSLAFSTNGEWLAGGTASGNVYVWQLSDGKILYSLQDQSNQIKSLVFTQDDSQLVVASLHVAWTWRFGDNQMYPVEGFSSSMTEALAIGISPKGNMIASARGDGTTWLQSLPDGKVIARLGTDWSFLRGMVFSMDGSLLATRSTDGRVMIWNILGSGNEVSSITLLNNYWSRYPGELAFSPDNKFLLSSRTSGEITVWSIPDGEVFSVNTPAADGMLYSLAFDGDGDRLAALFDNEVILWKIPKDRPSIYYDHARADNLVDVNPQTEIFTSGFPIPQSIYYDIPIETLDLDQAATALPFQLLVPTQLPEELDFYGAFVNTDGSVWLRYDELNHSIYRASLYIYEKSIENNDLPKFMIGESANIIQTQVETIFGEIPAEYVHGDWSSLPSFTQPQENSVTGEVHDVWQWNNANESQRLRWEQNGIFVAFYYPLYRPYTPTFGEQAANPVWIYLSSILRQKDLLQIASGMMTYTEVNSAKIYTIPDMGGTIQSYFPNTVGIIQPFGNFDKFLVNKY